MARAGLRGRPEASAAGAGTVLAQGPVRSERELRAMAAAAGRRLSLDPVTQRRFQNSASAAWRVAGEHLAGSGEVRAVVRRSEGVLTLALESPLDFCSALAAVPADRRRGLGIPALASQADEILIRSTGRGVFLAVALRL